MKTMIQELYCLLRCKDSRCIVEKIQIVKKEKVIAYENIEKYGPKDETLPTSLGGFCVIDVF